MLPLGHMNGHSIDILRSIPRHVDSGCWLPCDSLDSATPCVSPDSAFTIRFYATHTHTRLMALFPGLPRWAGTRKVKPIWILQKQETVSGSGISWAICKCAPRSRQIATLAPTTIQAGCPSCRPTNSVKALKAIDSTQNKSAEATN